MSFRSTLFIVGLYLSPVFICNSSLLFAFDYLQPLPTQPLIPKDNPITDAKVALGKRLFFDKRLSANGQISCNDCHNLYVGGDNDLAVAIGANGQVSQRSPPGLWNIGLQTVLYWDGRSKTLEEQATDHIADPAIMGFKNADKLIHSLSKDEQYKSMFKLAFNQNISVKTIAKALATFQRMLLSPNSAFDRYIKGDKNALTAAAINGLQAFNDVGCLACHFGVNFAGPAPGPALKMGDGFYELFPNNLGTVYDELYKLTKDLGRFQFSKLPNEKYMWRVPPLRNIALTSPYFHNGSVKTLHEAVRVMAKTQFRKDLTDEQVDNIVAFLNSLTGEIPQVLR